jgi:two-component system, OmpR family, response regulator QseB
MASILVIEDYEAYGDVVVRLLRHAGHEVTLCRTASAAVQALEGDGTDLVIADLFLPDKPGLDLIAELRNLHPRLPLIAMTGRDAGQLESALRLGVVQVLKKPFRSNALLEAVTAALRQPF